MRAVLGAPLVIGSLCVQAPVRAASTGGRVVIVDAQRIFDSRISSASDEFRVSANVPVAATELILRVYAIAVAEASQATLTATFHSCDDLTVGGHTAPPVLFSLPVGSTLVIPARSGSNTNSVCVSVSSRSHLIVDLLGYTTASATAAGASFVPSPQSVDESLSIEAGGVIQLRPSGGSNAGAVFNIRASSAVAGYMVVSPCNRPRPFSSSVDLLGNNVDGGAAIVYVLDSGGGVCLYSSTAASITVTQLGLLVSDGSEAVPSIPGQINLPPVVVPEGPLALGIAAVVAAAIPLIAIRRWRAASRPSATS